ncbi:pentulose and hexulose kinases [Fructobacillus pseudoficulneus]|uniref:Pentulose and hexulose kinases n=1 Tax=Fructobacillus pseudoficulneus TaxID=220714 RepID=A0A3F3H6V9_9LACO|nr:FGGY-family carbohydrate kinase [Fructobacillus pseudoficulneus]GAP02559.1 pentulose and hexulose kinases [Fructobacillus pseudoficulneus]SEH38197.1 xylulokinase [Fructobacillus pseudoficulneus]
MKIYLIIDIGTSSIRSLSYTQNGELLAKFSEAYRPDYAQDGSVTQSPATFTNLCQQVIRQAVDFAQQTGSEIIAVSMTSQRSSLIPTKNGQAITDAIMWQDTRVNRILDRYRDYDQVFLQHSGSKLNAVYLGAKMAWLKHHQPEKYVATDYFLNIPSYLSYQMTGRYVTDTTYGSRTNLMNIHELTWDKDLFQILGLDVEKMPELIQPGSVCGVITTEYSELTGLPAGIPVISAGGDQQCAALGAGIVKNDEISINTGTGGYLIKNSDALPKQLDERIIYNKSAHPDKYILEIDLLACSAILNWFLDNFYSGSNNQYQELDDDLRTCYGQVINLSVLPFHKGRSIGQYDTNIRSAFSNIGLSTQRKDMLYALMASLFVEINKGLGIFKSLGPIGMVTISGGLTNSTVMNQMQADAYNLTVNKTNSVESTGFGALISVLVQQQIYPSFEAAVQALSQSEEKIYQPNPENVDRFLDFDRRNQTLYETLKGTAAGYYKDACELA